jgi:hypothetical protein
MRRPSRPSPSRASRAIRPPRPQDTEALAAATLDAAVVYWRWLGEEFPRYARAVTSNLEALKARPADARETVERIARLTQEYGQVLAELPRMILQERDGAGPAAARGRRRQGRVID